MQYRKTCLEARNTEIVFHKKIDWKIWPTVHVLYCSFIFAVNAIVFVAILRYGELRRRKEYVLVASLAIGDAINGLDEFEW